MMEKTIQWIRKNNKSVLSVIECYRKVNKECFKFIKSQETSKDKFKNKDKMIKSFLIPGKSRKEKTLHCRTFRGPRNWKNNNQFNYINYLKKIF